MDTNSKTSITELKAKAQVFVSESLPKLRSELPSIRMLTLFYKGRNIISELPSASQFSQLRPSVSTYRQLVPKLEYYLTQIIVMGAASVPGGSAVALAPVPDASGLVRGGSASVPGASASGSTPHGTPSPSTVGDFRPQHFDQYSHLLPQSFRDFYATTLPQLYANRADHHTHLRDLALRTSSSSAERAQLARTIRHIDKYISLFWRRANAYYDVAIGKQVSQAFLEDLDLEFAMIGKSTLIPHGTSVPDESASGISPKLTLADLLRLPDSEEKQEAIRSRIERNKKYLRRTDRQKTEETKNNIALAVQELHSQGILITDRQAEVAATYGYEVPKDWQEPSLEERKAERARQKNEKARAERAAIREQKRLAKEEALLDDPPLD